MNWITAQKEDKKRKHFVERENFNHTNYNSSSFTVFIYVTTQYRKNWYNTTNMDLYERH